MKVILKHFTVYHICAPGHEDKASVIDMNSAYEEEKSVLLSNSENFQMELSSSSSRSNSVGSIQSRAITGNKGQYAKYPSLDELAEVVNSVVTHFGLKYFIGFGMGAGTNILCRYTLKNQDNVRALFLINPDAAVHGLYEWFKLRWFDIPSMKRGAEITDNMIYFLESHWFGYGQNANVEVSQYYEQIARDINSANAAGFIDSWLSRTDLGLVRTIGPDSYKAQDTEHNIRSDVCLVTGSLATDLARTLANMNGRMDPARTQFLLLAINFLYFLRTIGLLINMQPDSLIRQAEELQNQEFEALQNGDQTRLPPTAIENGEAETFA
ncbi:Protein ndrg1 [Cichlidogyrus casuarinus]|uniref:Protein ndrg1 n=1 Tax=Cichlidogyrus casuarinus TaxID=1844966 RepID=A0ABD2PVS7_9PLAT